MITDDPDSSFYFAGNMQGAFGSKAVNALQPCCLLLSVGLCWFLGEIKMIILLAVIFLIFSGQNFISKRQIVFKYLHG